MVSSSSWAITTLLGLCALQGLNALPHVKRGGDSSQCKPFSGGFNEENWSPQDSSDDLYEKLDDNSIKFSLKAPSKFSKNYDKVEKTYYNTATGSGPTFVYNEEVLYGRLSASIKAPSVGGAVTALIFKSSGPDEIDFELLAHPDNAQTNFFAEGNTETGVNGEVHKGSVSDGFHKYTIDWSPEAIRWSIDGQQIREVTAAKTASKGKKRFPSNPSQIQIGLWDGSFPAGTSGWAQGPVDWSKDDISAYIKDVKLECPY